jgi:colicin import membrane protein
MKFRSFRSPALAVLAALVFAPLSGCNKEEQAKAEREKVETQAKAAEAQREADEKKAEAAREAAETSAKADTARSEARASIQKDVDAADRKAADLRERAAKLKGNAKLNAEAASNELTKRRTALDKDLQELGTARGEAWDKLKAQTEKDVDAVEAAVDSFDRTLSGKS